MKNHFSSSFSSSTVFNIVEVGENVGNELRSRGEGVERGVAPESNHLLSTSRS